MRPVHTLIAVLIAFFVVVAVLLLSGCGAGEKGLPSPVGSVILPTPPPPAPTPVGEQVQAPPSPLPPLVAKENKQDPQDVRPEACE